MSEKVEFVLGVLNGAVGDYLARTGNGLATTMTLVQHGAPLRMDRAALVAAYPNATAKVVVLVHGLMSTENIWKFEDGTDYGSLLARDLGYTPLYVRYNSGLAIADNGLAFAELLQALCDIYPTPIEEILLIGYSMGGLIIRNACHVASGTGQRWLALVQRAIYVGTPHRGAPMERGGRLLTKLFRRANDPYMKLIAEIGDLRSTGVKDLGDPRHPVPLLPQLRHYLVAGSLVSNPHLAALFGDAVVPLSSATDGHRREESALSAHARVKILHGINHVALASHPDVHEQIRNWCEESSCVT